MADRQAIDSIGGHNGNIAGQVSLVQGPRGPCGQALLFEADAPHVKVPDHPAWQLTQGSIDLWLKADGRTKNRAVLSRDAVNTKNSGHFLLMLTEDRRLVLRIQREGAPAIAVYLCSNDTIVPDTWVHVGVNFGPPQAAMFLDGVAVSATDTISGISAGLAGTRCGQNSTQGIKGNNEPWFIGASAHRNNGDVAADHAEGMAIDQVRISHVRRNFAEIAP